MLVDVVTPEVQANRTTKSLFGAILVRDTLMNKQQPSNATVRVSKDGPYMVTGDVSMAKQTIGTNEAGESVKWTQGEEYPTQTQFALCRCGHSAKKPFCDGSHARVGFDGTETASREPHPRTSQGDTRSIDVVDRRGDVMRIRALLRSAWASVEPRERDRSSIGGGFS
jgi:CDGSH-type Zn-finger protein